MNRIAIPGHGSPSDSNGLTRANWSFKKTAGVKGSEPEQKRKLGKNYSAYNER
jgi:hypothetical protein